LDLALDLRLPRKQIKTSSSRSLSWPRLRRSCSACVRPSCNGANATVLETLTQKFGHTVSDMVTNKLIIDYPGCERCLWEALGMQYILVDGLRLWEGGAWPAMRSWTDCGASNACSRAWTAVMKKLALQIATPYLVQILRLAPLRLVCVSNILPRVVPCWSLADYSLLESR